MAVQLKRRLLVPDRRLLLPDRPRRRFPSVRSPHIWIPRLIPETAAVGYDASGYVQNTGSSISSISHSFTIGSALSNGALIGVLIYANGTTAATGVSMTWNGVSMTLIGNSTWDAAASEIFLFGLVNPAGGTNSLAASWTNASTATIAFWSFSGVDQTGGATSFPNFTSSVGTGSQTTRTATVTTVAGYATVACWGSGSDFTGTNTPTPDWKQNAGSFTFPLAEGQHTLSTGTSDSYTCTISASDAIDFAGCALKAAAGGPAFLAAHNLPIMQAVKRASYW